LIKRLFILILILTNFLTVKPFPLTALVSYAQTTTNFEPVFQKGMSYATYANLTADAYSSAESDESLKRMRRIDVDWVAINVVGWYQTNVQSVDIHKNPNQAPSDKALAHVIQTAKNLDMKIMLKPMIDLEDGRWRGEIQPSKNWFENYTNYIYSFAEIAEQNNVEMFCIGTELQRTASWETEWRSIISGVRQRYSGLLTYAANWWKEYDEYVKWWDALDYVGIDAYFPLSSKNSPTITEMNATWRSITQYLDSFHSKVNKPIIFTEIGYLSTDGTNKDPSNYKLQNVPGRLIDLQEQAECYEAAFQALWRKSWFYGFYWWYWQTNPDAGGSDNSDYTPQNKPAQGVLTHWYSPDGDVCMNYYTPENSIFIGISLMATGGAIIIIFLWRKLKSLFKVVPKG